jgi:hypothetical protein
MAARVSTNLRGHMDIWTRMQTVFQREILANGLMVSFVILTSAGAAMVYPPLGLIVGGLACGVLGFLLGLE